MRNSDIQVLLSKVCAPTAELGNRFVPYPRHYISKGESTRATTFCTGITDIEHFC